MKLSRFFKCFFSLFAVFVAGALHADISSVGFVHAKILELKGIDLPIPAGVTADQVNSVHYMMTQIDAVNAQNGTVTHYADGPEATMNIMSADQVVADVTELIVDPTGFQVTLTGMSASSAFSFYLSAAGNFTVDWGDGSAIQTLTRTNTTNTTYSHTYAVAGDYVVTIDGLATAYNEDPWTIMIMFVPGSNRTKMTAISGDLGKIFPILNTSATGSPRFYQTFQSCTGLTEIPADLFASVQGAPVANMFYGTFAGCTGLTGTIPAGLFAGIVGPPAPYMFRATFNNCPGLTGEIPPGLFGTLSGPPAQYMFGSTFSGCTGLTGDIPPGLFGTLSGPPAQYMFASTFSGCTGLTGEIPSGLFGTFTGQGANAMFASTFSNCSGLTGIADGIWDLSGLSASTLSQEAFSVMFYGCTNITSASPNIALGSPLRLYQRFQISGYNSTYRTFFYCTKMADSASIPNAWR